jgi:hypothetical protein
MRKWVARALFLVLVVGAVLLFLAAFCAQIVYELLQRAKGRYQQLMDEVCKWTL